MFNKTTKKAALSLAFGAASLLSANANAGFYAGLGFDMGFTVVNPKAEKFGSELSSTVNNHFGDKLTLGFDVRIGYEAVVLSRMYLAAEAYSRFMFDASGANERKSDEPYISGGLALKIGGTFNEGKTKAYAIVASEYMAGGINLVNVGVLSPASGLIETNQLGLVLFGGGLGMKQEILPFMDIFVEFKMMFDIFSHVEQTYIPSATSVGFHKATGTSEQTGSAGYQLMNVAVGLDFKF